MKEKHINTMDYFLTNQMYSREKPQQQTIVKIGYKYIFLGIKYTFTFCPRNLPMRSSLYLNKQKHKNLQLEHTTVKLDPKYTFQNYPKYTKIQYRTFDVHNIYVTTKLLDQVR